MIRSLRLLLVLLTGFTLCLAACTKKDDPTIQPGTISGQITPAAAITTVTATDTGGHATTATPNAAGSYQVSGLAAGSYVLTFTAAAGYQTPASVVVTVAAGTITQVPAVAVVAATGSLSGQVTPAGAATAVTATNAAGVVTTVVPDATGAFSFPALAPGPYTIAYTTAAGFTAPAPQTVTVLAGQNVALPPVASSSPLTLLTTPNWRITADDVSPGQNGQATTDLLALQPICGLDDFYHFAPNGVFIVDTGPTKCSASEPQTQNFTWSFSANQAKLTIYGQAYDLLTLTTTTLELSAVISPGNGSSPFTQHIVFTAF